MSDTNGEKGKHAGGRPPVPSLLTKAVIERLCGLIEHGLPISYAAWVCDLRPENIKFWIKRGQQPNCDELYREFFTRMKKSRAMCQLYWIGRIEMNNDGNWQRFAWFLERSFPDVWGRREPRPKRIPDSVPATETDIIREIDEILKQASNGSPQ